MKVWRFIKNKKTAVRKKKKQTQNYSELTFPEMLHFEKFSSLTKRDDCLGAVYIQGNFDQMGFSINLRYNHSTLGLCWRLSPSVLPLELESSISGGCHWDEWYSWLYLQTQSAWPEDGHLENSFYWRNSKGICSACVHILHCLWVVMED